MGMDFHTNGLYGMTRDDYLLRLTRVSEPGEFYRYNSGDTQMLAWLLENVYDQRYAEILSEKIWRPAGMEDDALVMHDREGNTFASMGLFATAKDAVRFGELFRNGGRNLDGEQVVPEDWVEASWDYSEETGGPRGYMWPEWSHGSYAAGYGHQRISVAPDLDMVGLRFGNDPVDSIAPKEFEAMYLAVADALDAGDAGEGSRAATAEGTPGDAGRSDVVAGTSDAPDRDPVQGSQPTADTTGTRDTGAGSDQQAESLEGQLAASATGVSSLPDPSPGLLVLGLVLVATATTTFRSSRRTLSSDRTQHSPCGE